MLTDCLRRNAAKIGTCRSLKTDKKENKKKKEGAAWLGRDGHGSCRRPPTSRPLGSTEIGEDNEKEKRSDFFFQILQN